MIEIGCILLFRFDLLSEQDLIMKLNIMDVRMIDFVTILDWFTVKCKPQFVHLH